MAKSDRLINKWSGDPAFADTRLDDGLSSVVPKVVSNEETDLIKTQRAIGAIGHMVLSQQGCIIFQIRPEFRVERYQRLFGKMWKPIQILRTINLFIKVEACGNVMVSRYAFTFPILMWVCRRLDT